MENLERPFTDAELRDWRNEDRDIQDDLFRHFIAFASSSEHWVEVSEEVLRVWNVMFDEEVEESSTIDAVLSAAVFAGHKLAILQICRALGLYHEAVEMTLERFGEEGELRSPVSAAEFIELHDEDKNRLEEILAGKFD